MFGISDYGAFAAAFVLLLFLPGPGNLALISSASKGGLSGGLASVMGLLLGDQVLLWLTVAGLAAVLQSYPAFFTVLQWAGAAYLAWLGFKMFTAQPGEGPSIHISPGHYFRETLFITLLNPKAITSREVMVGYSARYEGSNSLMDKMPSQPASTAAADCGSNEVS
jgi:threonine/homoserine/homoserine lactone efflux protein